MNLVKAFCLWLPQTGHRSVAVVSASAVVIMNCLVMLLGWQVYGHNQIEIKNTIITDDSNNTDECIKPCTLQALYLSVQHQV